MSDAESVHPNLTAALRNIATQMESITAHWGGDVARAETRLSLAQGVHMGLYNFDVLPPLAQDFLERWLMIQMKSLSVARARPEVIALEAKTAFLVINFLSREYETALLHAYGPSNEPQCFECGHMVWSHKGQCLRVGCHCKRFAQEPKV